MLHFLATYLLVINAPMYTFLCSQLIVKAIALGIFFQNQMPFNKVNGKKYKKKKEHHHNTIVFCLFSRAIVINPVCRQQHILVVNKKSNKYSLLFHCLQNVVLFCSGKRHDKHENHARCVCSSCHRGALKSPFLR